LKITWKPEGREKQLQGVKSDYDWAAMRELFSLYAPEKRP